MNVNKTVYKQRIKKYLRSALLRIRNENKERKFIYCHLYKIKNFACRLNIVLAIEQAYQQFYVSNEFAFFSSVKILWHYINKVALDISLQKEFVLFFLKLSLGGPHK